MERGDELAEPAREPADQGGEIERSTGRERVRTRMGGTKRVLNT